MGIGLGQVSGRALALTVAVEPQLRRPALARLFQGQAPQQSLMGCLPQDGLQAPALAIAQLIEAAGLAPSEVAESDKETLVELARSKRELLRRMIAVESNYIGVLNGLEAGHARQKQLLDEYEQYLGELILWLYPSNRQRRRSVNRVLVLVGGF